jgi:hypothetical protein
VLFILNGWTPSDESREFTYLTNGGCNIINYILSSLVIWQATTHLKVIIDDTHYYMMGADFDHKLLHLQLSIDCSFIKPQHKVVTKKFLPTFKYDKSKAKEYLFALITNLRNLWVVDPIRHLGANGLADLL